MKYKCKVRSEIKACNMHMKYSNAHIFTCWSNTYFLSQKKIKGGASTNWYIIIHFMRAIARAYASTRATGLMRVNIACVTSVYDTYYLEHWIKKMKEQNIRLNIWSFSLNFVNLSLIWMLYFYGWLQNKEKTLVWREYYNQFGIY